MFLLFHEYFRASGASVTGRDAPAILGPKASYHTFESLQSHTLFDSG